MSVSRYFLLILLFAGANVFPQAASPTQSAGLTTNTQSCDLLTSSEIQAVQGQPVKEAKPSQQRSGRMLVSQCFFLTPTFSNAVSLLLASPSGTGRGLTPEEFWSKQFKSETGAGKKEDDDADAGAQNAADKDKEHDSPPLHIDGLGDDAFYVGSAVSGALYVRHGNSYFRVSVGGVRDQNTRIARCRALAESVLKRL